MAKKSNKVQKVQVVSPPSIVKPKPSMYLSDEHIPKQLKDAKLGQKVRMEITAEVTRAEQFRDYETGAPRTEVRLDLHKIRTPAKPNPKGGKK
jgi:hypothetical protein